jgi:hypothetical protein
MPVMNNTAPLYPRLIKARVAEAMTDTPVVLLAGPRQAGKTTLVRQLANREMRYLTLDDELTLLAAREDPVGMIRSLDRAVIDEIQRAPQLLLAIKKSVDEDRRPGRFLLTGSANLMVMPTVADSLAGRMETLTLLPLSQSELHCSTVNWLDRAFAGQLPEIATPLLGTDMVEAVLKTVRGSGFQVAKLKLSSPSSISSARSGYAGYSVSTGKGLLDLLTFQGGTDKVRSLCFFLFRDIFAEYVFRQDRLSHDWL